MSILNSDDVKRELDKLSNEWADWQEKVILLDEGRKAMFSKCFLRHKLTSKTAIEAENKARQDKDYQEVVKHYAKAEGNLIKSKYGYNNLDRQISFKQTEIKLELNNIKKNDSI